MSVKIRLTKIGRHKDPFFRIVAIDSRTARDGKPVEQIGYLDPAKGIESAVINEELALKWLNLGAIPSDTVKAVLSKKGIMAKYSEAKKPAKAEKKEKAAKKPAAKKTTAKAKKAE